MCNKPHAYLVQMIVLFMKKSKTAMVKNSHCKKNAELDEMAKSSKFTIDDATYFANKINKEMGRHAKALLKAHLKNNISAL